MKRIEEPVRWMDPRSDAPADVRNLVADSRDALGPTHEELARLETLVAGAVGTGAAAGATKAAVLHGGHALTKAGVWKLAAVLALGGAGAGVGWSALRPSVAPPHESAREPSTLPAPILASSLPERAVSSLPVDSIAPAPSAALSPAPSAGTRARPAASMGSSGPPATNELATPSPASPPLSLGAGGATALGPPPSQAPVAESELALLDRARARMSSDPSGAMRALDEHRISYPSGTFAQEREVLAIEALVRLGRRQEAERRAAAFAREFPGSAHRRRIAVLLGQDAGP